MQTKLLLTASVLSVLSNAQINNINQGVVWHPVNSDYLP